MSINQIIVNGLLFFISCSPYNLHKTIINSGAIDDPNAIISDEIFVDPREITDSETIAEPSSGSWKWILIKYGILGVVCCCAGICRVWKLKRSNKFMSVQVQDLVSKVASILVKIADYESLRNTLSNYVRVNAIYDGLLTAANIPHDRIWH
jgi:hypothetical protein